MSHHKKKELLIIFTLQRKPEDLGTCKIHTDFFIKKFAQTVLLLFNG